MFREPHWLWLPGSLSDFTGKSVIQHWVGSVWRHAYNHALIGRLLPFKCQLHLSTKSFSILTILVCRQKLMSATRWYAIWSDPRSRSRKSESWKMANFNVYLSSACMNIIKILMVYYDTPRQYLNFKWIVFWYSSLFGVTRLSRLGCPHTRSLLAVRFIPGLFLCLVLGYTQWHSYIGSTRFTGFSAWYLC